MDSNKNHLAYFCICNFISTCTDVNTDVNTDVHLKILVKILKKEKILILLKSKLFFISKMYYL